MSRLQLFRPVADSVLAGPFNESSHDVPAILSFFVEGSKLRSQNQYALARRARSLRHNATCPSCERARVIPLDAVRTDDEAEVDGVSLKLAFACEHCGTDWVA